MKRLANSVIINDELAEGAPDSHQERESADPYRTMTAPQVSFGASDRAPIAETGLIAAVVLPAEGEDRSDVQDATRTTAEIQMTPQATRDDGERTSPLALIVEDTFELAEVLAATLQRMNITTVHESHGNRACVRYSEMNPDVVLLDISLPDITGWKVLDAIKECHRETGGRLPIVIVITAYGDAANRLVGKLQGVYSYLVKPFTADEVEEVVRGALSGIPA